MLLAVTSIIPNSFASWPATDVCSNRDRTIVRGCPRQKERCVGTAQVTYLACRALGRLEATRPAGHCVNRRSTVRSSARLQCPDHRVGRPTSYHSLKRNARLLRNRARSAGTVKGGLVEKAAAEIDAIDLAAIVLRRQSGGHVYVRQLGSPRPLLRSHCKWTTVRRGAAQKQLQRTDAKAEEQKREMTQEDELEGPEAGEEIEHSHCPIYTATNSHRHHTTIVPALPLNAIAPTQKIDPSAPSTSDLDPPPNEVL